MSNEQESIQSIVLGFIITMLILVGVFGVIEIFPVLTLPILIVACVGMLFEARRIWKRYKELRREN